MMSVEQHLNNIFTEGAKQAEQLMKDKVFSYKYFTGLFMDNLKRQGTCTVESRRYDRSLDCDILVVIDCDTKERFSSNQFAIHLEEIA